jgi:hypothetical protein
LEKAYKSDVYKKRIALDIMLFPFGKALFLREVLVVSSATINFKIIFSQPIDLSNTEIFLKEKRIAAFKNISRF